MFEINALILLYIALGCYLNILLGGLVSGLLTVQVTNSSLEQNPVGT